MKVLLTGATGFIGKNLKEYLQERFDLTTPDRRALNLTAQDETRNFFGKNTFDVVIHCANTNNVLYKITDYDILNLNLQMFFNLESCHDLYGKLYYFGSGAEYDMRHYVPRMAETYFGSFIPQDPYGFAKYTMSRITEQSSNIYDLRLFGVYGKYEEWQRRFISNNLCKSIKNMDMTINKNVRFDYLYIDDLCQIVEWFLKNKPKYKHYNVCTGCAVDLYSIAQKINQVTGMHRKIQIFENGWKPEYSGDNSRLRNEVTDVYFTPMEEAIRDMYCYYQSIEEQICFN